MWTQDIVDYLASAGIGVAGTDLFWGILPDTPKRCGAVLPAPGAPAEEAFGSAGVWLTKPRAQYVQRAGSPDGIQAAFETAQAAYETIMSIGHARTIGTTMVLNVTAQSPGVVEMTESGLPVVGFGFSLEIEQ